MTRTQCLCIVSQRWSFNLTCRRLEQIIFEEQLIIGLYLFHKRRVRFRLEGFLVHFSLPLPKMLREGNIFLGVQGRGWKGWVYLFPCPLKRWWRVGMSGEVGWICRRWVPSIHGTSGGRGWCPSTHPLPNIGCNRICSASGWYASFLVRIHLVLNDAKMVQSNVF